MKLNPDASVIDFGRAAQRGLLDADFVRKTESVASKTQRNSITAGASVLEVNGVGPRTAKALEQLGIRTIGELAQTKAAFPLEASFNPRQAAALVSLHAGLQKTLAPRPAVDPRPTPRPAVDPRPTPRPTVDPRPAVMAGPTGPQIWEQQELARAPRNRDGTIPVTIETGINKWGWYDGYTTNMTDVQYLQHRKEQIEHQVYLHELHYP